MRDAKAIFAAGNATPGAWPVQDETPSQAPASGWRLARWFARKPPTLYQRCLAVHIYHASRHTSLH